MRHNRIHRATTEDGVEIAGRVHGEGPPLVFVHGALGDGETVWEPLLPFMTDQYTCYLMSLRGRGLSGIRRGNDLSREHLTADVTAFLDSIGEPVGVVGLSGGALLSLAAAEKTSSVSAVAAYEPPVFEVMSEDVAASFKGTVQRMGEVATTGRMADAVRTFLEFVTNEEELTAASELKLPDALAPNVPVQLEEFAKVFEGGPSPTDPSALARIDVPVLLLHGTRSKPHPWFVDGVRHVAEYVPSAEVREIAGAGHLAPILEPAAVADELHRFFSTARHAA
jgi:pimeloyl-ACP methyl ester carboxylesterase